MNNPYPTPSTLSSRGVAKLLRFPRATPSHPVPLLVVPSPIARWRHLHPRRGPNLLRALGRAGFDVFCLDWGEPFARDRDLSWDELVARVGWAREQVLEHACAQHLALLGFSLGGTLGVVSAALQSRRLAALLNLSGPVDFAQAGALTWLADPRWFSPAVPSAVFRCSPPSLMRANVMVHRMMAGRSWLDHFGASLEAASPPLHELMETWAQRHVPLPPDAFQTYVRELIQANALIRGRHRVSGRLANLAHIQCPLLAVGARHDSICKHQAVTALAKACGSQDATCLVVPGGHLGSVVGRRADRTLHDPILRWLSSRLPAADQGDRPHGPMPSAGVQPGS